MVTTTVRKHGVLGTNADYIDIREKFENAKTDEEALSWLSIFNLWLSKFKKESGKDRKNIRRFILNLHFFRCASEVRHREYFN